MLAEVLTPSTEKFAMSRLLQLKVIVLLAFVVGNTALVVLLEDVPPLADLAVVRAFG